MPEQNRTVAPNKEKPKNSGKRRRGERNRSMPWIVRLIITAILLFIALLGGLVAGYVVVGEGDIGEVFDLNTYKHMYDLIFTSQG